MNHWPNIVSARPKSISSQKEGEARGGSRGRVQPQECDTCWEKVETAIKTHLRQKEIRRWLDQRANWCWGKYFVVVDAGYSQNQEIMSVAGPLMGQGSRDVAEIKPRLTRPARV